MLDDIEDSQCHPPRTVINLGLNLNLPRPLFNIFILMNPINAALGVSYTLIFTYM